MSMEQHVRSLTRAVETAEPQRDRGNTVAQRIGVGQLLGCEARHTVRGHRARQVVLGACRICGVAVHVERGGEHETVHLHRRLEEHLRGQDVVARVGGEVAPPAPARAHLSGAVEDCGDAVHEADGLNLREVGFDELEVRDRLEPHHVRFLLDAGVVVELVGVAVDTDNSVAFGQKSFAQVASEEAAATGYEADLTHVRSLPLGGRATLPRSLDRCRASSGRGTRL